MHAQEESLSPSCLCPKKDNSAHLSGDWPVKGCKASYSWQAENFPQQAERTLAQAEQAARKALALDPTSVVAKSTLGGVLAEAGKNAEAIRFLRQAAALAPNDVQTWDYLGYAYHYAGLTGLAEEALRHSRDLNPSPPRIYWMHGRMLTYQGRAHEAVEEARAALERTPEQFKLMAFLGYFLYYDGNYDEAERWIHKAAELRGGRGDDTPLIFSAYLHAMRGERDQIDPAILAYRPEQIVDGDLAEWVGSVYALMGEKAQALAFLRRAIKLGNHNYPWFLRDKNWNKLRGDPDYERLMREVEGYWRQYTQEFSNRQLGLIDRGSEAHISTGRAMRLALNPNAQLRSSPQPTSAVRACSNPRV